MKKIIRTKKLDEIEYRGNNIRLEAEEDRKGMVIWITNRGQMPSYGRIDMDLEASKELAEVLPAFIKELEKDHDQMEISKN